MQDGAKRPLGRLVFEDAAAILIRVAGMDDERQAGCAAGCNMGAKAARLGLRGAVVVEVVEPGFAERMTV